MDRTYLFRPLLELGVGWILEQSPGIITGDHPALMGPDQSSMCGGT